MDTKLCKCGCGREINTKATYVVGHARKWKHNSPEHNQKLSIANSGENNCHYGKHAWNYGLNKESSKSIAIGTEKMNATKAKNPRRWSEVERTKRNKNKKPAWNKGLTKETDERVAKYAEKSSKVNKGKRMPPCKEETRILLSKRSIEVWQRPDHREKVHKALSGVNHPYYKNRPGLTPDMIDRDYPLEFDEILKENIRNRDNRVCKLCNKTEQENGLAMDVHHIDHDKTNLNWINLVSLCKSCHGKTEHNQEYWQQFFNNLLLRDIPLEMRFIGKQQAAMSA